MNILTQTLYTSYAFYSDKVEKTLNRYKFYKSLSKLESELLNSVNSFLVFSYDKVLRLTGWKKTRINEVLKSLKKKGLIIAIKKNNYIIVENLTENLYAISNRVIEPSYISFWTAASFYGYTEQQLRTIQLVTTKQHKNIKIQNFMIESTTYNKEKFYGYLKIKNFIIADKEKLIIDILFKPEKSGGMDEVRKIIKNMWLEIDEKQLLLYLKKFKSKSIYNRLGYLLDELKLKNSLQNKIITNITKGFIKLNQQKKQIKNYNKLWRIVVND